MNKLNFNRLSILSTMCILFVLIFSLYACIPELTAKSKNQLDQKQVMLDYFKLKADLYDEQLSNFEVQLKSIAFYISHMYDQEKKLSQDLGIPLLFPASTRDQGLDQSSVSLTHEGYLLQRIGVVLKGVAENNNLMSLAYYSSTSGISVFSDDEVAPMIKKNAPTFNCLKRPWYLKAIDAGDIFWSKTYVDAVTKKICLSTSLPVYNNSTELIGVVGFDLLLTSILNDLNKPCFGLPGTGFIVNEDGEFISEHHQEWKNRISQTNDFLTYSGNELITSTEEMIGSGKTGIKIIKLEDKEQIIMITPLPRINVSIGVVLEN